MQFLINTLISSLIIAGTVELSKRSNLLAAMLISLPISSLLAFAILYVKTGDVEKVRVCPTEFSGWCSHRSSSF